MKKKLIKVSEYRKKYFSSSSAPAASTIYRWIENHSLAGERVGNIYYVDENKLNLTGDPLVDNVMMAS